MAAHMRELGLSAHRLAAWNLLPETSRTTSAVGAGLVASGQPASRNG